MLKTRYGSLGILGHILRNKIPLVGNWGESEVDGNSVPKIVPTKSQKSNNSPTFPNICLKQKSQ